ncbi:MAG TPA: START-like domain-containing protein [Bacteroidales bacterium]|nr:START-like domain-containing protein [Bacteroidales bacterium]
MGLKSKYELEYSFNTPVRVLYERLSTPEGLSEWFADEVIATNDIFVFKWHGVEARARKTVAKENKLVRFEWIDFDGSEENSFSFEITTHELTGDTALIITDYAEIDEKDDAIYLWDTQIARLKTILGLSL